MQVFLWAKEKELSDFGTLFIVATPIGHLGDLSFRAKTLLTEVSQIAAEDTRHSQRLLNHYGIHTPLFSLHAHNEHERSDQVIELLKQGQNIALITDAGTPLISDPGYPLVARCHKEEILVVSIPGPCAAIAALSISGIPCSRFSFEGFLPAKTAARENELSRLKEDERTLVFYVSPHRVVDELNDMIKVFGQDRLAALVRELTKQFETVLRGNLSDILKRLETDPNQLRGEMVLIISGLSKTSVMADNKQQEIEKMLRILLDECPLKQAVKIAADISGEKKNAVYAMALRLKKSIE
ncbi:MAG: rsmI [Gammaproteobacteria bacterium]|jgi:16S rRNA (cytidine1402-2'-O)-methyltransferase|nr:rsmI [Gammaproteobacteria bacterium]